MNVLKTINLLGFGHKYQGKVRDFYIKDNLRILVATDRISAFDRVLGHIPHKGQVLNQLASFWFNKTQDIIQNHQVSIPDPNVMVAKNTQSYPIEIVVRGYISGSTKTSLWTNYAAGKREIYGLKFPDGLKKNSLLPKPIVTPTTRATGPGGHDEQISRQDIIDQGIISKKRYEEMEAVSLALFERGQKICEKAGIILVDTKYEFGEYHGKLMLIDEIHTPDSSRFWVKKTYQDRFKKGEEPENYDKEFFRLWFSQKGYVGDGTPPKMPNKLIIQVSQRYIDIFELITGTKFEFSKDNITSRIKDNLKPLLDQVVIIAGSHSDKEFVDQLMAEAKNLHLITKTYFASAHRQTPEVLKIINRYQHTGGKHVIITVAGRSNALSGMVAANSRCPVIACPPFKDKMDYWVNIHSSLQMPSQTPALTVIDPGNAILSADKILKLNN